MSEIRERDDAAAKPDPAFPSVNVARRRFARAGAAVPVVLGTLTSRPVLGAESVYHCTVSGQLSGNVSYRPGMGVECISLGKAKSYWLTNVWPNAITKGTLPIGNCKFTGNGNVTEEKGAVFNGFGSSVKLTSAFFAAKASDQNPCTLTTTSGNNKPATLYHVLSSTESGEQYVLGRATVVSLLNVYGLSSVKYPVSAATIIAMFNATFLGGQFEVNATVKWSRAQVIAYLTSLYPPG